MLIPRFWAEARIRHRQGNRQFTIRRFGWSDTSQDEAQAMAEARANEALQRVIRGEPLVRHESSLGYSGVGLPIREEILEAVGKAVVTRNSYGARCLNTPDVLFADVDAERPPSPWLLGLALMLALAAAGAVFMAGSAKVAAVVFLVAFPILLVVMLAVGGRLRRSGRVGAGRDRIARFVAAHPGWAVRVYETPSGLRAMATHTPRSPWPVPAEKRPAREAWIARYEAASRGYAACRFLEAVGSGTVHIDIENIRRFHDDTCRALDERLPMA